MLSKKRSKIVKLLKYEDVNTLHLSSYKSLVNLRIMVKNRYLKKQVDLRRMREQNTLFSRLVSGFTTTYNRFSILDVEEGEVECRLDLDELEYKFTPKPRQNTRFDENEANLLPNDFVRPIPTVRIRDRRLLLKLKAIILKYVNQRRKKEFREDIPMEYLGASKFEDVPLEPVYRPTTVPDDDQPCCSKDIRPEMMEPEQTTQQQDAGPVVLNTIEQVSTVVPADVVSDNFWVENSTSDAIVNLPHASQMEIMARQFEWSSDMMQGYEIFQLDLPGEPISGNMSHAAAMLFGQYAYWNGDMKVKIHINTTPFHVGKLVFSWYYAQHFDANASDRDNIASAIQLPHVCYDASEGGDAVLEIPYRNYRSMICTRAKQDDSLNFYMGTLTCRVFNPLTADTSTVVDGYIHVSILNSKFTGICPRRDVQPEMMTTKSLVKTAETALHVIDACANMDKPNNPAVPIMYTPQFTDSFSTGTNDVSNVHVLRLDPLGQTQHPSGSTTSPETSLKEISRKWGYLKTLTWSKSQNKNMSIYSFPVSPELPFDKYYQTRVTDRDGKNVFASVLPPVSALCCINAYNRGSLEVKIEFVNSRYHTGALLAAFTPVHLSVDFKDALQSYNATLDLGNTKSYIFKIPYINERPYNPRYNTMHSKNVKLAPIGSFNLYVLNQLRAAAGVSDHVYVNLYLRAGDDFEFAVPVSPLYSINLDKTAASHKSAITPTNFSVMGIATWRYMSHIADRAVVIKSGKGDDSVMQFDNLKPFVVYKRTWKNNVKLESSLLCGVYQKAGDKFAISQQDVRCDLDYIAMIIVNNDGNKYAYAAPFPNSIAANSYVLAHKALVTEQNPYPNSPTLVQWYNYDTSNVVFYCAIRPNADDSYRNTIGGTNVSDYVWTEDFVAGNMPYSMDEVESQMDIMSDPTISTLATTMSGMRMFGERFADVKDYLRRYQLYGSFEVKMTAGTKGKMLRIPLSYLALNCTEEINGMTRTITREGLIPYLLSMYRFGRGGIRMKIIIVGNSNQSVQRDDEVYYLQHKPDVLPHRRDAAQFDLKKDTLPELVLQSGYAYTAFSSTVNNTITVDIPCYIPTNMLMLQAPNYNRKSEVLHYFLGVLDLYLPFISNNSSYNVTIHYAMSDDFQASDFVGFPPMTPLYKTQLIRPEMADEPEKKEPEETGKEVFSGDEIEEDIVEEIASAIIAAAPVIETPKVELKPTPKPQGPTQSVPVVEQPTTSRQAAAASRPAPAPTTAQSTQQQSAENATEQKNFFVRMKDTTAKFFKDKVDNFTKSSVREALDLPPVEDARQDTIGKIITDAIKKFGEEHKHVIVSFVSQLAHCIQHPTVGTFVTALLTILMHLGLNCYSHFERIMVWFRNLFTKDGVQPESEASETKTEKSLEENKRSFARLLVDLGASAFGKTKDFVSGLHMPNFSGQLFTNIRLGALTANSVITLVKNIFDVVPKIFTWLGKTINPKRWLRWLFSNKKDMIQKWISDVEYCIEPNNLTQMRSNMYNVLTIEMLVIVGRDIHSKLNRLSLPVSNSYFLMLIKKLDNLYIDVAKTNLTAGSIGIEPFCICLQGESQVGKTYVTKDLCSNMLKHIGYKTNEALFYTRPPGSKHWDGVERQPVCIYDDFLHIKTPDAIAETIGEFLLLKSKATFSPPRAAIEDKGKKYNPLIVALTMNEAYPVLNEVAESTAWMRRRDFLIEVKIRDVHAGATVEEIDSNITAKFDHLWFFIKKYNYEHGRNAHEYTERSVPTEQTIDLDPSQHVIEQTRQFTYKQIRFILNNAFKAKYDKMIVEFLKDLKMQTEFSPDAGADFEENVDAYRKWIIENRVTKNKRELETLKHAQDFVEKNKCTSCDQTICVCDVAQLRISRIGTTSTQAEMEVAEILALYREYVCENDVIVKSRMQAIDPRTSFGQFVLQDPCIHKWILMNKCDAGYVIDEFDNKFVLVNNETGDIYDMDTKGCKCEGKESTKIEVLAPYYMQMAGASQSFRSKYNSLIEDVKVFSPSKLYVHRMEQSKLEFMKWMDEKIHKESWLSKTGKFIMTMLKPLTYVIGIFCAIYLVKEGVNFGVNVVSSGILKAKTESNKLFAKMVESHVVTDKCVNEGCRVCALGEMAYTDRLARKTPKKPVLSKVEAQMSMNSFSPVDMKLRRNYFFLCATKKGGEPVYCRCLGLQGQWFMAVDHYFHKIQSMPLDTLLEFVTAQVRIPIYLTSIEILTIKNSALVLGRLPLQIPAFPTILKRFAPQCMIPNICREAMLYVTETPVEKEHALNTYNVTLHRNDITLHDDTLHVPHIVDENAMPTTVETYFQYQTSGPGLCGSVLITEMNCPSPIIGMHIAGAKAGGCGYSEVICYETLEGIISRYENIITDVEIEGQMFNGEYISLNQQPQSTLMALEGNIDFMGTVPNKYKYKPPYKSKCIHSLCYNQITTSTYDVPHLSAKDERFEGSPMYNGCMHHTNPVKAFEQKDLDLVFQNVKEEVFAHVVPLRQKIGPLSVDESICGIPNIIGYDAMEMDTSEGFPFSSIRPKSAKDKKWLFDLDLTATGYTVNAIDPILIDVMDRKHEMRVNGKVPMTVFIDCLKDLKLPKEKCHKTRVFSISPVDFTIQFRQYFYDFTVAFQAARFNIESAVGIDVDSYEWHNMVQLLLDNSTHFVCGDYSKFGPRLMTSCVLKFFEIITEWYQLHGDTSFENKRIRMIMAHEIAFSNHLMLNLVYRVYCGAPSGCPITTILNNGVNMMYMRMAFLHLVVRSKGDKLIDDVFTVNSLSCLKRYVCMIFYGDDLIMTVKPEIIDRFNANAVSQFFAKYDIVFTDALKTGKSEDFLNVFSPETSFLKRNIGRHHYRPIFVAKMDKRAIEETCNWVFQGHDEPEASVTACEAMMINAFGHGPEYYGQLRERVMQYWQKRKIVPRIPLWTEIDERIFD
ncbi:hypothetical protein [Wuhan fly virus 4]|uniref:hypothetical protein n=1 Tax=Wuhan fly virus 4 TaxID=1923698 RepID=UPI000909D57C|nr:hypothetical protein [Wuhan fly virus 4]APG77913.1 hypothetical protein [Wuhan fly virus 4]